MSQVKRRKKKTTQMSITSLIDILTILLLFVMVNVSSDPDNIPDGMKLEDALFNEDIPKNSKIISLNVSYVGGDTGVVYYQKENTTQTQDIFNFSEIKTIDTNILLGKKMALDGVIYDALGDNIGDTPVIVRVKAHKNTPFKYISFTKRILLEVWNDETSLVRSRSKSREFKLFFATNFLESEASAYYRVVIANRLGGI